MELLETDDPVKGQLLKKSARHREQLQEDARLISEKTEQILTNAVIIGGALAVTYFLVSRFSGSKQKKKSKTARIKFVQGERDEQISPSVAAEPEPPGIVSQIGTALASQATVFLLGLAKEKLGEFLQSQQTEKKPRSNEPS
jgi:hypothetical protein